MEEFIDIELAIVKTVALVVWLGLIELDVDAELVRGADVEAGVAGLLEFVVDVESEDGLELLEDVEPSVVGRSAWVDAEAAEDVAVVDSVAEEGVREEG